eukprot:6174764-Pleurochrysis_carterae.AAC.2
MDPVKQEVGASQGRALKREEASAAVHKRQRVAHSSTVVLTPLSGVGGDYPAAYLLEIDGASILLDVGADLAEMQARCVRPSPPCMFAAFLESIRAAE